MCKNNPVQPTGIEPHEVTIQDVRRQFHRFTLEVINSNPDSAAVLKKIVDYFPEDQRDLIETMVCSLVPRTKEQLHIALNDEYADSLFSDLAIFAFHIRYELGLEGGKKKSYKKKK